MTPAAGGADELVRRLRAAGCVFAEDEARLLLEAAADPTALEAMLVRRVSGEPLEHVVGRVAFGDLSLSVGPGVFVPRQRTLLLARVAAAVVREQDRPVLVEACCGVAPVAASVLAAVPGIECHVSDHDPVALTYARRNLPSHAGIHRGSGLTGLPAQVRGRVSVLAAVPPYVPDDALDLMPREAREHEPAAALSGGPDGLDHVRALLAEAPEWLRPGGRVLVELGADQLGVAVAHARQASYDVSSHVGVDARTAVLDARFALR